MTDATLAAWAQAVISGLAILASGAIAVFVPWNERRQQRRRESEGRLSVSCDRREEGGLTLSISYRPEFQNSALGATVTVKLPSGAYVFTLEEVHDTFGSVTHKRGGLSANPSRNGVHLWPDFRNGEAAFCRGTLIIEYPDERIGPNYADIQVDILEHGNHLILRSNLRVSPIREALWPGNVPHVLLDKR